MSPNRGGSAATRPGSAGATKVLQLVAASLLLLASTDIFAQVAATRALHNHGAFSNSLVPLQGDEGATTILPLLRDFSNIQNEWAVERISIEKGTPLKVADNYKIFLDAVYVNGTIYMVPHTQEELPILAIDTHTNKLEQLGYWPTALESKGFSGGCFDGDHTIWLVPYRASAVVRVDIFNPSTMVAYTSFPGVFGNDFGNTQIRKFLGGCYDGNQYIYMAPSAAKAVLKINKDTGEMEALSDWPDSMGVSLQFAFYGAICSANVDGGRLQRKVWLAPHQADRVVVVLQGNTTDGEHQEEDQLVSLRDKWPAGKLQLATSNGISAFAGGVFDARHNVVWMVPTQITFLLKIDVNTHDMVAVEMPSGYRRGHEFQGAVFDGELLYLIPSVVDASLTIVNTSSATHEGLTVTPSEHVDCPTQRRFRGAVFDGHSLWLVPDAAQDIIYKVSNRQHEDAVATNFIWNQQGASCSAGTPWKRPMKDAVEVIKYNISPISWPHKDTEYIFWGMLYDAQRASIWVSPAGERLLRFDINTGAATVVEFKGQTSFNLAAAYRGVVYDGVQYAWLVPCNAKTRMRIDLDAIAAVPFKERPLGFTWGTFYGGAFDGNRVWYAPRTANRIMSHPTITSTLEAFDTYPSGAALQGTDHYCGAVFDGSVYIYFIPYSNHGVGRIDRRTGSFANIDGSWPDGFDGKQPQKFCGGSFAQGSLFMSPMKGTQFVVKLDRATNAMAKITISVPFPADGSAFSLYDGGNLYIVGLKGNKIFRLNVADTSRQAVIDLPWDANSGITRAAGIVMDDQQSLWIASSGNVGPPYNLLRIVEKGSPNAIAATMGALNGTFPSPYAQQLTQTGSGGAPLQKKMPPDSIKPMFNLGVDNDAQPLVSTVQRLSPGRDYPMDNVKPIARGAVYDFRGGYLWLVPSRDVGGVNGITRIEVATGNVEHIAIFSTADTVHLRHISSWFGAGVYNPKRHLIHFIPREAQYIYNLDPASGKGSWLKKWSSPDDEHARRYIAGAVDPLGNLWVLPHSSTRILRYPPTGDVVPYFAGTVREFYGGVVAAEYVVVFPFKGKQVLRINTITRTFTRHGNVVSLMNGVEPQLIAGTFDWRRTVFMVSNVRLKVVKFDVYSGHIGVMDVSQASAATLNTHFAEAASCDGHDLYFFPSTVGRPSFRLPVATHETLSSLSQLPSWEGALPEDYKVKETPENMFRYSGTFDGRSLYLIPMVGRHLVRYFNQKESKALQQERAENTPRYLLSSNNFNSGSRVCGVQVLGGRSPHTNNTFLSASLFHAVDVTAGVPNFVDVLDSSFGAFVAGVHDTRRHALWLIPWATIPHFIRVDLNSNDVTASSANFQTLLGSENEVSNIFSGAVIDEERGVIFLLSLRPVYTVTEFNTIGDTVTRHNLPPVTMNIQSNTISYSGLIRASNTSVWIVPAALATNIFMFNTEAGSLKYGTVEKLPSNHPQRIYSLSPRRLFVSGVVDDQEPNSVWMVPHGASGVLRIRTTSPYQQTLYQSWPGGIQLEGVLFSSATYDAYNKAVWLSPRDASMVVKVNAVTGAMTGCAAGIKPESGGPIIRTVFDGRDLWMLGYGSLLQLDTKTGVWSEMLPAMWPGNTMIGINEGEGFQDIVYDGRSLWLIPRRAKNLVRVISPRNAALTLNDTSCGVDPIPAAPATPSAAQSSSRSRTASPTVSGKPSKTLSRSQSVLEPTAPPTTMPPPPSTLVETEEPTTVLKTTLPPPTTAIETPTSSPTPSPTPNITEPPTDIPPPTPQPNPPGRVVSVSTVLPGEGDTGEAVMTAAGASTAISSVASASSVGSSVSRVSGALRMLDCPLSEDDPRPSMFELPAQFDMGGKLGYYSGAVLLQSIFVLSFFAAGKLLRNSTNDAIPQYISFALAGTLVYFGPFILAASVTVLYHDSGTTASAFVVSICSAVIIGVRGNVDKEVFNATKIIKAVGAKSERGTKTQKFVSLDLIHSGEHKETSSDESDDANTDRTKSSSSSSGSSSGSKDHPTTEQARVFLNTYQPFFDGSKDFNKTSLRMYGAVEFWSAAVVSMLAGIRPDDGCENIAWLIGVVSLAVLLYLLVLRPYRTVLDTIFTSIVNVLQTAMSICTLLALRSGDPEHSSVSWTEYILTVLVAIFFLQLGAQLFWMWYVGNRRQQVLLDKLSADEVLGLDNTNAKESGSDSDDESEMKVLSVPLVKGKRQVEDDNEEDDEGDDEDNSHLSNPLHAV